MLRWLHNPEIMMKIHGYAAVLWAVLAVTTTIIALVFPDSKILLAWVIFMSGYANVAAHWSAMQGAQGEVSQEKEHA